MRRNIARTIVSKPHAHCKEMHGALNVQNRGRESRNMFCQSPCHAREQKGRVIQKPST